MYLEQPNDNKLPRHQQYFVNNLMDAFHRLLYTPDGKEFMWLNLLERTDSLVHWQLGAQILISWSENEPETNHATLSRYKYEPLTDWSTVSGLHLEIDREQQSLSLGYALHSGLPSEAGNSIARCGASCVAWQAARPSLVHHNKTAAQKGGRPPQSGPSVVHEVHAAVISSEKGPLRGAFALTGLLNDWQAY